MTSRIPCPRCGRRRTVNPNDRTRTGLCVDCHTITTHATHHQPAVDHLDPGHVVAQTRVDLGRRPHTRRSRTVSTDICTVEDCDRPRLARGWCQKHYRSLHSSGPCRVATCTRMASYTDLCNAHYKRLRRLGSLMQDVPVQQKRARGSGSFRQGYPVHTMHGVQSYDHREAMAQIIGRPLHRFENVHHKNGIRNDNRPENLELWTKKQPYGQRVSDLVDFIARYYADEVVLAIADQAVSR